MHTAYYEPHNLDPKFPIVFHRDFLLANGTYCLPHWHENLEILCFVRGSVNALIDMQEIQVKEGDVIVVPSNAIHQLTPAQEEASYYCLIVDRSFCADYGFDIKETFFRTTVRDPKLVAKIEHIAEEFRTKPEFYRSEVLAGVISVLVYLARRYSVPAPLPLNKAQRIKLNVVKRAFSYVDMHYAEPISMDELAESMGFSKSYFCHVFREVTGMPPSAYINFIRCRCARKLLSSGKFSVGEAAFQCGFENLSYFSKTYKRYMGELPSKTAK